MTLDAEERPRSLLRVATWNCGAALRDGPDALSELEADVVSLQNVAAADLDGPDGHLFDGHLFVGPARGGLAAVPFNGWSFAPSPEDPELPGLLYCRVLDPARIHVADLAAVWALTGRDVASYTEQFAAILSFVATRESTSPLVVAGDLNSSTQGADVVAHATNLDTASRLGLTSAYHSINAIEHGAEPEMTLRWWGRDGEELSHHCDFIFCSGSMLQSPASAAVGDWNVWVESGRSDHAPVIAAITL